VNPSSMLVTLTVAELETLLERRLESALSAMRGTDYCPGDEQIIGITEMQRLYPVFGRGQCDAIWDALHARGKASRVGVKKVVARGVLRQALSGALDIDTPSFKPKQRRHLRTSRRALAEA
jgi:hypothetical protein